jgi:hypothetical protein
MNNLRVIVLIGLLISCMTIVYAGGNKEKEPAVERRIVQVTGLVRLVGSAPLNELVISSPDGEWYITRSEMSKLFDLQHRTVTVEGEETIRERSSGGNTLRLSMTQRILSNVRILTVYDGVHGFD